MSIGETRETESHPCHSHQSNNWFWKDVSVDTNVIRWNATRKTGIHRISKYLSTNCLLIAKGKNHLTVGESGQ